MLNASKTTTAPYLLRDKLAVTEFVNADLIDQGLSGFGPESVAISGGRRGGVHGMNSDMHSGLVDEFLDVAVERPVLDQHEVEIGRTLEDRVQPGLTGDDREERHLEAIDQNALLECG